MRTHVVRVAEGVSLLKIIVEVVPLIHEVILIVWVQGLSSVLGIRIESLCVLCVVVEAGVAIVRLKNSSLRGLLMLMLLLM